MGKVMPLCGFSDEFDEIWALAFKAREITGKNHPNFLLVPTPAFDEYNRGTLNCYHKLGCSVDTLLLTRDYMTEETIKEKMEWADMVWVPGGNVKFLMETWKKTGADRYMREAFEDGTMLFGTSAGSMCWFAEAYDNCAPYDKKMFVECLGLFPYCVCPHFNSENWKSFEEDIRTRSISGLAIEDGAALCLIDGKNSIFTSHGTETVWFFDANDNFKKYDLRQHPEILENL